MGGGSRPRATVQQFRAWAEAASVEGVLRHREQPSMSLRDRNRERRALEGAQRHAVWAPLISAGWAELPAVNEVDSIPHRASLKGPQSEVHD